MQHLARARGHAAHVPAAGIRQQREEVAVASAVAVLEQSARGDAVEHLAQAALVVARLVRGDHELEARHPRRAQLPVDARLGRAAVEQHARAGAVLDQRRVALADVQERDRRLARSGRRGRDPERAEGEQRRGSRGGETARPHRQPAPPGRAGRGPRLEPPREPPPGQHRGRDGGVGGGHRDRRPNGQRNRGARQLGEPARQAGERPGQHAVHVTHRADKWRQHRSRLPGDDLERPEPHDRRDQRQRSEIRSDTRQRERAEVVREERRGGDGGGERDRGALGQRARQPSERVPQPGREQEDSGDRRERQLPAGVAGRERVERQGDRRREQQRVPAGRRPADRRRGQAGDRHHAGALQRRAGARQRHVHRHQREQHGDPQPRSSPRGREQGSGEREQQHHVLAADRQHVGEARALEVVAHPLVDRLVLAEHHPPKERRAKSALAAPPERIDGACDPAAPSGGAKRLERDLAPDAAAVQVRGPVERRARTPPRLLDESRDVDEAPGARVSRRPKRPSRPQQHVRPAGCESGGGGPAEPRGARPLEQHGAATQRGARGGCRRSRLDAREP